MGKSKQISERMCLACRQMKDKRSLLRIVRVPCGDFLIDRSGKQNGRGAYICDNADCITKCIKGKLLNRNFKCEIPHEIYDKLSEEIAVGGQD